MPAKPDILLIILDTLRRDHLSTYGYWRETSPCLDDFSTRMTVFDRAIAPAQWTVPSHASMFTGIYPGAHQLTQANGRLSRSYPTLAEILQVEGYHTVGFSNNPLVGVLDNELTRGFDAFYNYFGASPKRPMERSRLRRAFATQFRRAAGRISNLFAQHDDLFRWSLNPLFFPTLARFANYKGDTERSLDDLLGYWTSHHAGGAEGPMFAFLNLMGAHTPYRPPQDILRQIDPALSRDRHAFSFISRFNRDPAHWASPIDAPLEAWQSHAIDAFYDAEIAHQDRQLGHFLKALDKGGHLDNTLVIIAADHGEGHGDHRFFGHGFAVYQELVHVPLMIYDLERFPAKSIRSNVSTRRIFHTILDCAGIAPPLVQSDVAELSLLGSLQGKPEQEADIVYAEAVPPKIFLHVLQHRTPHHIEELQLHQTRRGLYQGHHKLAMVGESIEGLFDISADPAEQDNIAAMQAAVASDMRGKVLELAARMDAPRKHHPVAGAVSEEVAANLRQLGYFE